jgi:uncharacterized membrane protein YedE/YeeE
MPARAAGLGVGVVFGVTLSWSGLSSPEVIRDALLFKDAYLFLLFASAVLVAAVGIALLRRAERRALLVDAPITCEPERPARRHLAGAALFGLGWGIADACPGPIATQVGQGIGWALFTFTGVVIGVYLFVRREQPDTEPATDVVAPRPVKQGVRTRVRRAPATR